MNENIDVRKIPVMPDISSTPKKRVYNAMDQYCVPEFIICQLYWGLESKIERMKMKRPAEMVKATLFLVESDDLTPVIKACFQASGVNLIL